MWTVNPHACQCPLESQQKFPPFGGCGLKEIMYENQEVFPVVVGVAQLALSLPMESTVTPHDATGLHRD
jgi:hypothetical protein